MSAETKAVTGERISWRASRYDDQVMIGDEIMPKAELSTGIMLFLAGQKRFTIASMDVVIPDSVDGVVKLGNKNLPYNEFIDGVVWVLAQMPGVNEEGYDRELGCARLLAADKILRPYLEKNLPKGLDFAVRHAHMLRQEFYQGE